MRHEKTVCGLWVVAGLMVLLSACGGGGSGDTRPLSGPVQGARILGMDVKEIPSVTYAMAYDQAMALGVREVSLSLDWALLEPSLGNYDNTLPAIINVFYPMQAGDVTLVLRPLDTPGPSLPADLAGRAYDDPAVIAAFEAFLSNLHAQLPELNASGKLRWIHIGNEIDAWLGADAARWGQWRTFFRAARAQVRSLWGNSVQVGSIIQFPVLMDATQSALYATLVADLDIAVLTYYPLNADFTMRPVSTVADDFALMSSALAGKTIFLQECGYPSSTTNNSSLAQQAEFISAVFSAWDTYADRIRLIDIAWQYDVSDTQVDQWVNDFGMAGDPNETAFRAYLGSLGLSNFDATEKPALQRLREELVARNWGS
ncbi:MAG TPA: hypothetical protein ENJ79_04760 [Gammaproteobacteria bacterium]|nr:hypothetical protein [Gammaproteobacteria bacterium]